MHELSLCLVIPTYNEAHNIGSLVKQLYKTAKSYKTSVLVIDDGSVDGTGKVVTKLEDYFDVCLIDRGSKKGLGSAIIEGLKASLIHDHDYIVTMDADFSHDPRDVPRLIEACRMFDISLGSRYIKGGAVYGTSVFRRIVSRVGNTTLSSALGINIHDCTSGFKCYKTEVINHILPRLRSKGYDIQVETLYWALKSGFKVTEVPIIFKDRSNGKSKINPYEIARCLSLLNNCSEGRITTNSKNRL